MIRSCCRWFVLLSFVLTTASCGDKTNSAEENGTLVGGNIVGKRLALSGTVTTFAGGGGIGATDGNGTMAQFDSPGGVTTDGANLFIADTGNHTIRKVDIATGNVTTIAGSAGLPGFSDGVGSAAKFNSPSALTTDGRSLFTADTGNNTIRKIDIVTGNVTTLAGAVGTSGSNDGTGSAASFSGPSGITTDAEFLYVADTWNHTIRKVNRATGAVTTLAGQAGLIGTTDGVGDTARFIQPTGITTNGTFLYVTDEIAIRRITIETGEVTTIAGNRQWPPTSTDGIGLGSSFRALKGVATDGSQLFVADSSTIRRIILSSITTTTIAGNTSTVGNQDGTGASAFFNGPWGITTNGSALFVVEYGGSIRKIE